MKELNQTTSFGTENKDLDCEIVREHLIPFWEMEEITSFKSHINKALKNYNKESGDSENPEIQQVIFKLPKKKVEDIDNPIVKLLITEKELDDNYDVVKIVQDYVIEIGSKFYCSEKKANCTIESFEPFDYHGDGALTIIVRYEDNEKGKSSVYFLSPI